MQSCINALDTPAHVTDTVLLSFLINWFDTKLRDWCSELYGFGSTAQREKLISIVVMIDINRRIFLHETILQQTFKFSRRY